MRPPTLTRLLVVLTRLLVIYLALDFSNPMLPGAVGFGADASVEGRRVDRVRDADAVGPPQPVATPQWIAPVRPPAMVRLRVKREARPLRHVRLRRAYPSLPAPDASSEDH